MRPTVTALHLLVRSAHVLGMAVLVGGAGWVWNALRVRGAPPVRLLVQFEWVFWGTVGVMLATGVGNLGALGAPGPHTRWGTVLTIKLLVVLAFLLGSFSRTLAVVRLRERGVASTDPGRLRVTYAATAGTLLVVVALAEVLAHG